MATKEAAALALAVEEGKTRDLYNALRTGEHGVGLEALAQSLYFLQHAEFTLFDVKDAFCSSTGASECFLAYREFQIALGKIARVKFDGNCGGVDESVEAASSKRRPRPTELELMCSLVDQLTSERLDHQLDTLRCQMTRSSALDTLEVNLPLLVQSFQLYGSQNRLSTNIAASMLLTITLDGFVDFLNAYFEYEEFFSFDDLALMSTEVLSGFAKAGVKAEAKGSKNVPGELNFAQFMELFCRVASAFHQKLLVREGAQLRRAVESCRLEFSLEVLLDHMHITHIPNDSVLPGTITTTQQQQEVSNATSGVKELASQSPRGDEVVSMALVVQNIRDVLRLDAVDHTQKPKQRLKREGSLIMQGQLSRRPSSNPVEQVSSGRSTTSIYPTAPQHPSRPAVNRNPPPQVTMIREVIMPPPLPSDLIQLLESALKFQNMAQFNMALSALDSCKQRYQGLCPPPSDDQINGTADPIQTEVQLFFTLQAASVYDSAHRDAQALAKYYEAMKLSRQLPASHPGRLLVKSCVGVTLFYVGELALAQQCHQLVLDARKSTQSSNSGVDGRHNQPDRRAAPKTDNSINGDLVDTATAMNNLACCFSQDQSHSTSKFLDNAYLLFKHARQNYTDAFGPAHPRVELIARNLDRVRACQSGVVSDAAGALARGEYAHVIPGSRFQIQAFEFVAKPLKSTGAKGGKAGGKKKKKGAK
ncbi:hypothetical protein PHYPSEUDO_000312 [Phytophthora pseudosyringae]|uniref:Uncharacterized protein n=1 Tax=Phytophthora pseudosyringae TaxID=221518 RepID=A0A8T1W2N9_9STRA|nr:hypothetical protein PHYPSEUDO_000312 [Phytophthora pseudosyringae]